MISIEGREMICDYCGVTFKAMFMLPDEVWGEVADNTRDLLCANCICNRLGRMVLFVISTRDAHFSRNEVVITTRTYGVRK